MKEINLLYWKYKKGSGNFGDELSKFIVGCLLNKEKYKLSLNKKNSKINLIGIGSYINKNIPSHTYIYGSGIRTLPIKKWRSLNVYSVRGPLTKKYLKEKNSHIKIPNIYGDPALLLSIYYKPIQIEDLKNKIGLVPHFSNYQKYKNKNLNDRFYLINPTNKWEDVINKIFSCKYIISSSLHGLICSDAYNKPNLWLDEFKLDEGDFKFKDYFESQDRKYVKITNLDDFEENLLYREGNKINLELLVYSFPFK